MRENLLPASPGDPPVLVVDPTRFLLVFQIKSSHSLLPQRGALSLSLKGLWGKYLKLHVCGSLGFCLVWWVVKGRGSCQ